MLADPHVRHSYPYDSLCSYHSAWQGKHPGMEILFRSP